jgi:hypothetical protein
MCDIDNILRYCLVHENIACCGPKPCFPGDESYQVEYSHCGKGSVMHGEPGFTHGNYCSDCIKSIRETMKPYREQREKEIRKKFEMRE